MSERGSQRVFKGLPRVPPAEKVRNLVPNKTPPFNTPELRFEPQRRFNPVLTLFSRRERGENTVKTTLWVSTKRGEKP